MTARRELRYRLRDDFLRFWFRFVFPFQEGLRAGLRPGDHYDAEVAPALAEHVGLDQLDRGLVSAFPG